MQYETSFLLSPEGRIVWKGPYEERLKALDVPEIAAAPAYDTLADLLGSSVRPSNGQPWINPTVLRDTVEQLGIVTRKGCVRGFFTQLPQGTFIERCVDTFNVAYFEDLGAVEIDFPVVFDGQPQDMQDLTLGYEKQGRMFRLEDNDSGKRLSYAADPGFFAWLRGRTLKRELLPFTVTSPTTILRRYRDGEVGPLHHTRQYKMSDTHTLVVSGDAESLLLKQVGVNARAANFWVGNTKAQFLDATKPFLEKHPGLPAQMATVGETYTLINTLVKAPRYYDMRSGMMVDAGTGALMMYNIQWDEENSHRFDIALEDGSRPVVIHANALAGSGLLCTLFGRALAEIAPRRIPPEVALSPIVLLPLKEEHIEFACQHAERLKTEGIPSVRVDSPNKSLGKAIWALRKAWQPAFAVIGDKEALAQRLIFQQGATATLIDEEDFLTEALPRIKRCWSTLGSCDRPLPFASSSARAKKSSQPV